MATDFNPPQNPPGSPVPKKKIRREDALAYHSQGRKGKIEVVPTNPCLSAIFLVSIPPKKAFRPERSVISNFLNQHPLAVKNFNVRYLTPLFKMIMYFSKIRLPCYRDKDFWTYCYFSLRRNGVCPAI
jgi:hypothetical protein